MSTSSAEESGICRPSTTQPSIILPPILPHRELYLSDDPTKLRAHLIHRSCLTIAPTCIRALLNTAAALPKSLNTDIFPTYLHRILTPPPKMSTYADRLASFAAWPHASPTPEQMARAGFKHMPTSEHPDNVICKTCGNLICNWKPDHDPKIQRHIYHHRCSTLWLVLATAGRKMPSTKDLGFFDPSLEYDFPELCLFQNVKGFCDRIRRLRSFFEGDILDLLPKCLRGDALKWFDQWFDKAKHRDLATCLGAMRARFWQQAPPEAPPKASQAPPGGPPEAAPQASSQTAPQACQTPDYHHCKLCNASFSSIARLIRHTQENTCNKPCCRHCEKLFSSKNQLHRHLREECQKQRHRASPSPSPICSPRSSSRSSPSPASACSPPPTPQILSPPPAYRAISPSPPSYLTIADLSARYAKPPYLKVDDLIRMFGGRSATTASSTITITIDDPFARPFVFKKSMGSTQKEDLGLATSCHQIAQAQCSLPHSICERCRRPPLLYTDKRQAMPNLA